MAVLAPGTPIGGKYVVEQPLGKGGMGVVYAARHAHLGTRLAVKVLHHDDSRSAQAIERFQREARSSAQLRGEHICRVSDFGEHEGAPYLVMDLLEGQDLGQLVEREGPLEVGRAAELVLQALVGIAEAHAAGIVHRDLKPGNLFLTTRPDGTLLVKVLDFGVAKVPIGDLGLHLTLATAMVGSPAYMAPEQLQASSEVDARADIWAIGVILYELVVGERPFLASSLSELAAKIALDPPPPLAAAPAGYGAVIARCLEKEPVDRFTDLGDLADALAPFSANGAAMATMVRDVLLESATSQPTVKFQSGERPPASSDASAVTRDDRPASRRGAPPADLELARTESSTGGLLPSRRGNRTRWIVLAGGAVAIAAVLIALGMSGGGGSAPSETPTATAPLPPAPASAVTSPPVAPPPAIAGPSPRVESAPTESAGSATKRTQQPSRPGAGSARKPTKTSADPYGDLYH